MINGKPMRLPECAWCQEPMTDQKRIAGVKFWSGAETIEGGKLCEACEPLEPRTGTT
jgi:hypothetical protein